MFHHILVPLDGSLIAECVLPHVAALAKAFVPRVTLFQAVDACASEWVGGDADRLDRRMQTAVAQSYLDQVQRRLSRSGVRAETMLAEGDAGETISSVAKQEDVDLILLSSHGRSGPGAWNLGSVACQVALLASTSLMVVRAYRTREAGVGELSYRRVLIPVDGSEYAECVFPMARALATCHACRLVLAHILTVPAPWNALFCAPDEQELCDRLMQRNHERIAAYLEALQTRLAPFAETRLVVDNSVVRSLCDLAEQEHVDLILMSAYGLSGQSRWPYRSVPSGIIMYGDIPLIVQHASGPAESASHDLVTTTCSTAAAA